MTGTERRSDARALKRGVLPARSPWRTLPTKRRRRRHAAQIIAPPVELVQELSEPQADVMDDATRFRVVIAGRRFGKTYLACVELLTFALEHPGTLVWYVAPTRDQARDLAWDLLKSMLHPAYIHGKPHESRLTIRLKNGTVIQLKGAQNVHGLRGRGVDFLAVDEFTLMRKVTWEVLRPSLAVARARVLFIGTPQGFNWAYDMWERGLAENSAKWPEWKSYQYTTLSGGRVSAEEINEAAREQDPRSFRQEFLASFEALSGRVYAQFDRIRNVDRDIADFGVEIEQMNIASPHLRALPVPPIYVGMDFNVNPMTAVIGIKQGDSLQVIDALQVPTSNTEEVAKAIRARYPSRKIICCPDPSGRSRHTNAPMGQTDHTILERYGFDVRFPSQAPKTIDGINAVNALLCSASGERRLFIHPRAKPLIKGLDGLTFREGLNEPDKKSPHIHICDALKYLVWQEFNLLEHRSWLYSTHRR